MLGGQYGVIAQLVECPALIAGRSEVRVLLTPTKTCRRVVAVGSSLGSYPGGRWFKSSLCHHCQKIVGDIAQLGEQ